MNPTQNLELAHFLAGPPRGVSEEACHRAACGRAYYAAFATARDLLIAAGLAVESDASAHATVVRLLRASSDQQVKKAGIELGFLRIVRNEADYDLGLVASGKRTFDMMRSHKCVMSAANIIRLLRRVGREDRRLRIPQGIH